MHRLEPTTSSSQYGGGDGRIVSLEAQLSAAHDRIAELEARDSLKTQFFANISHDLRTPLTAVITHAEILRDGILGPLSERQLESITGIINGGRQLLEQVGEILTYARGAANRRTSSAVMAAGTGSRGEAGTGRAGRPRAPSATLATRAS